VIVIPINMDKSEVVQRAAESLYAQLVDAHVEVLLDDRSQRPGFKFADADLLGIPHRVVIAEKQWTEGLVEYKRRTAAEPEMIGVDELLGRVTA